MDPQEKKYTQKIWPLQVIIFNFQESFVWSFFVRFLYIHNNNNLYCNIDNLVVPYSRYSRLYIFFFAFLYSFLKQRKYFLSMCFCFFSIFHSMILIFVSLEQIHEMYWVRQLNGGAESYIIMSSCVFSFLVPYFRNSFSQSRVLF